jgi:hypothetical protein
MTVHATLRHGALGASAVAAVTTLLLAAGCSAPPGTGVDTGDEVPEFAGSLGLPGNGLPGNGSPGNGSSGVSAPAANGAATATGNTNAPASGAGGSANTSPGEPIAGSGIGLQPAASNANAGPSSGAGGSSMAGMQPGTSPGAAGSSFEPAATGSAGSTSMPPSANPPQTPPAQNPPPAPPAQNPPPTVPPPPLNADCAGAFFCDGFENVADGASPAAPLWTIIDGYSVRPESANVLVSADNARSGARALRVTGTDSRTGIRATLPQTRYFVRAWLQIDAAPLGPVFIGLGTDQNSEARLRIQGSSFATINSVGPGDKVHPDAANEGNCPECVTLVPNEWFCAEFFMDDATQNATLWIDGVEAASKVNGNGGWPVQPDNPFFFLGSMSVQGGMTGVWIDDVAAGPTRLGCD